MKFYFFLFFLFVLICKSNSQNNILNSLNEINKDDFKNEDIYNYLMNGESIEFNKVLNKDKVYKHLIDKNSDFPLDSLIGLNTNSFIDENVSENDVNIQMRSSKLPKQNSKTNDLIFNNRDARSYLDSLKKININELKKILRAVLIYTRSPSFELINAYHFFQETLNKIFKTLDLSTLFFEFENGIHTRVSCIVCMVIANFFKSPVFYHISAEKIINGLCYLKLPNEKICNLMADNFGKTLEFIRRNSKLTVEETCGALLGNQCLGDSTPKLNWTINLPILVNKNYRDLIDVNQNDLKTKENTIFVGQLTDVHVDPFYKVLANATCKEPVCCRKQLFDRTKLQFNNIFKQLSVNDFHLPFTSNIDEKIFKDNFFINSTLNSILAHDLRNITVNFKNLTLNFGKRIVEIASIAGIWGDYNDCDTPTITFDLVLDSLKKFKIGNFKSVDLSQISLNYTDAKKIVKKNNNQPLDYVMWNGDIPPHDFWHYTKSYITNYIKESTRRISKHLKDVPVIPVLGNHEAVPINCFSPDFNDLNGLRYEIDSTQYFFNKTTRKVQFNSYNVLKNQNLKKSKTVKIDPLLTSNWLYKTAAENWATWLPDSALETVRLTGSYVIEKNENLRLIILNTNYCARINFWTWYDTVDPGNQLKFLVKELYEAENKNQLVHIIGHVPPDHLECTQAWLENYLNIIHRFKHVIRAQFFGHTHRDEYRVYYGSLNHQKNIFNELGLKGSGLEKLYERDLAKLGPVKPSPTYTPVTSATSSTLSKLKKSIEKIRNSLKNYSINWKPEEEQINLNKIFKNKFSNLVSNNDKTTSIKAKDNKNNLDYTVAGFAFVAPSVTSYSKTNPAYRVYAVNDNTGYVLDYNTFFFNLTEAKIQSLKGINYEPVWKLEYSARQEYKNYLTRDQGQFTEYTLHLLQQKINNDEKEFDKFYRNFYVQSDAKEAISFDQTKKKLVLQNMMIRDPLKVWPFKIDQLYPYSLIKIAVMYSLCESADNRLLAGGKFNSQIGCQINEETVDYFYGCVCREVAEYILHERNCGEGLYLLRQSNGDFVLSLCNSDSILHYRIIRFPTGELALNGLEAQRFTSIDLLISSVDGLATRPTIPCLRSKGWTLPPTYWGVDANLIKQTIIKKTREWGLSDCLLPKLFPCTALTLNNCEIENRVQNDLNNISTYALMQHNGQNSNVQENNQDKDKKDIPAWQQHLLDYDRNLIGEVTKSLLLKSFHEIQPWYHGRLNRLDAEKRLLDSGHKDGKFLVREREENGFALCVSHEATIKHYRIDALSSGEFAIQDGHKFPSILALISHYTVFSDGLWTSLTEPCQRRTIPITNSNILNDTNSVQNLNILNRALNRASDIYPTATYSIQQPNTTTGNSTSSSSSCSSNSSSTTNRLNNSSKAKIKEWLVNINQRWSQLLASMQCRPNGSHQLIHDCDSIKYGIVQYSNTPDPSQINMYNYQLYSAAVAAATAAVAAAKQQQLTNSKLNLKNFDCNHHVCSALYGQCKNNIKNSIDNSLNCQQAKFVNTTNCLKNNCKEFDKNLISLPCYQKNSSAFQNLPSTNENSNLKSMLDLSSPLIYLDYNKGTQNSLSFRSLNCETNTRQLYGLLSGNDNLSINNKAERPWSNTATLAPKRVSTQSSQNNLKNQNIQLIQKNLNKQNSIQNLKGQTLPTIYESNHYKETDLQLLFNSFNNQKNSSIPPPLPPDPPPASSNSISLTIKKNNINTSSSNIEHHHQPSAVLKQLPNINKNNINETDLSKTELILDPSNNLKTDNLKIDKNENEETINLSSQQTSKVIKNDNHTFNNKFEEVITIYQRPVPLPGRIVKSSSLEDLFKIKVCKLNPLCPNNEITDKQKAIIFCANPGPLAKIKDMKESKILDTSVSKLMNPNINLSKTFSQVTKKTENQSKTEAEEKNTVVIDDNSKNDTSAINESNKNDCLSVIDNEIYDYSKNSLNTAIAASFKGFLGDLQACKQNQLALSTFRPILGNSQNSTGITGTLNTSSSISSSINNLKVDSAVEQINTMANPYSFSSKKQLTKQSSQELTIEQLNKLEQQTDITDLLKEFDVCFADEGPSSNESSSNDLISFTNELNNSTTNEKNNLVSDSLLNSKTINNNSIVNLMNPAKNLENVNTQRSLTTSCSIENTNNSLLANLLDTTALKQASLGPATLETCGSKIQLTELDLICFEEDPEKIKETLQKYKQSPLSLDPNFINLKQKLGNGFFGEVFLGEITANSQASVSTCAPALNVAVKVLKSQNVPNHKMDILKEAQTMASLDHKHIVRLIGVCESDPLMLIMELAPIGPLNRYLQENQNRVRLNHILVLMRQVALAMRYLETKMYIHRDLAARNVLLVNEHFVKISDFGMSRALGIGKEYYKARNASKWPLKWYAPECIYYFKFSSKSDVWSYGVTLWEATSYGKKPYEGMDGQKILKFFRENKRLSKPANCPEEIYQLMWCCWQLSPDNRPSFVEICDFLTMILCRTHFNQPNKISN